MSGHGAQKVTARHLARKAFLYVRQSSLRQVLENQESTRRQYALRDRAAALGWPLDQIVVVDQDQGESGASAVDRAGFARVVSEVGMGRVGIVLGLEVSRLARNNADWHRLLEICAVTDTLILDEDGIYDPAHFNDRLLLGLKGTMSEAELHVLRARLRGGILSKARRGELPCRLPVGFVYDAAWRVVLDPDAQVQGAVRLFFETFRRTGSAKATVHAFRTQGLLFPRRLHRAGGEQELLWGELAHSRALGVLHNPRYAGAFVYGRKRHRRSVDGRGGRSEQVPREEWIALLPGTHAGYISWEHFEENQRRLRENSATRGEDRRRSPPREGPALLQGLVLCGVCGERMTVRYTRGAKRTTPHYLCQRAGIERAEPLCQCVPGAGVDRAVGALLVEAVTPHALETALAVQSEIEEQLADADALRRKQVERARYEVDLARRRFLRVDPDNRLVADALEAEWNRCLRDLAGAQEEYERQRTADRDLLGEQRRAEVLALSQDFPRLWNDPETPMRERKRMARLLVEDVTLRRGDGITVHVRFRAGPTRSLELPRPLRAWELRRTPPEVVAEIDRLLDEHGDVEIARLLDDRGLRSGTGGRFTPGIVGHIRVDYGLRSRAARLRARGMLTRDEVAAILGVSRATVDSWRRRGVLRAQRTTAKGDFLYEHPGPDPPRPKQGRPRLAPATEEELTTQRTDEVQCAT
jgi:DNA invertase Pin-like site-specific DNA recombinase